MLVASYALKKELKEAIGKELHYEETSMFGAEYTPNGEFCVIGPAAYARKWYATVIMDDGKIKAVK